MEEYFMSGFCERRIIFLTSLGLKYEWFYSHESNVMHTPELPDPIFLQVSVQCLHAHSWDTTKTKSEDSSSPFWYTYIHKMIFVK